MRTSFLLSIGFLCVSLVTGSHAGPKVGDEPPLLQATMLLQAPPGASLDAKSLQDKIVVLEFWATWCGPCVAAIPHMNKLADEFKGKPVQFIAITAEEEGVIKPFLAKRPIHAWVALDTNHAMNEAYSATPIPRTVILGRDGKIAAITHPVALTEEHLNDLLAGRKINLPIAGDGGDTVENKESGENPPLFQILVRPSVRTNSYNAQGGGSLIILGSSVLEALSAAFDVRASRILTNAPLPEGRFDFMITLPNASDESLPSWLRESLKTSFGLTGMKETNNVPVWLLKAGKSGTKGLVVSTTPGGMFASEPGNFHGTWVSMSSLAEAMENYLHQPVIDETGLDSRFEFTLKWEQKPQDQSAANSLVQAVREQLGLELVPSVRPVEMIRIRNSNAGKQAASGSAP